MRRKFVWAQDSQEGNWGFTPETGRSSVMFTGLTGFLIAHDVMEHKSFRNIGTFEDELFALGAAIHVRGDGAIWNKDRDREDESNVTAFLEDIYRPLRDKYKYLKKTRHPSRKEFKAHGANEVLERGVKRFLENLLYEDDEFVDEEHLRVFLRDMVPHVARGYLWALKKYYKMGGHYMAADCFNAIEEEFDRIIGEGGHHEESPYLMMEDDLGRERAVNSIIVHVSETAGFSHISVQLEPLNEY